MDSTTAGPPWDMEIRTGLRDNRRAVAVPGIGTVHRTDGAFDVTQTPAGNRIDPGLQLASIRFCEASPPIRRKVLADLQTRAPNNPSYWRQLYCPCSADNLTSDFVTITGSYKEFVEDEGSSLKLQNHHLGVAQRASCQWSGGEPVHSDYISTKNPWHHVDLMRSRAEHGRLRGPTGGYVDIAVDAMCENGGTDFPERHRRDRDRAGAHRPPRRRARAGPRPGVDAGPALARRVPRARARGPRAARGRAGAGRPRPGGARAHDGSRDRRCRPRGPRRHRHRRARRRAHQALRGARRRHRRAR